MRSTVASVLVLGLVACGSPNSNEAPFQLAEPTAFASILYPEDNPTTRIGLALGRDLFFDPILSQDSSISCSSCHQPALAFTDGRPVSVGIHGRKGKRNAPSLTNIGYLHQTLFWDGRADDLESQALHPVADANEMGGDWPSIISRLRKHPNYWPGFQSAFGLTHSRELQPDHVGKALAQFQRSLISSNTKYDQVERGAAIYTEEEALGHAIFFDLADDKDGPFANLPTGECAHCHTPPHFTNQRFFNNGIDQALDLTDFADPGRGAISRNTYENGLFRAPGLRNVALTAPYMHDGRMKTLEEVVAHYNSGGNYAENKSANIFPLGLTSEQEKAVVAFLRSLTDESFLNNTAYQPQNSK
ncbi:MAG: cytochrome c peroxidase [Bacteroidota bacterium]